MLYTAYALTLLLLGCCWIPVSTWCPVGNRVYTLSHNSVDFISYLVYLLFYNLGIPYNKAPANSFFLITFL